jgi:hypothetical protein
MATQKPTTTKSAARFAAKDRPTPSEAKKAAAAATGDNTRPVGRPKADHGLTRTSILADKAQMHRLKVEAVKQDRHMYELLSEAIEAYLAGK